MLSGLKRLNPFALPACILPQLFQAMFVRDPVVTAISLAGGIAVALKFFDAKVFKKTPMFIVFAVAAGLLNTFVNHRGDTPFVYINDSALTFESFFYGFRFAFAVFAAVLWFALLTELFTSSHVIYVFGRISPSLALVVSAALRYIPLFTARIKETSLSHTALGSRSDVKISDRVRSAGDTVATMVAWSCETAIDSADSMRARGYGAAKRRARQKRSFKAFDGFVVTAGIILFAASVALIACGGGEFNYFPVISFSGGISTYLLYAVSALLSFLPAFVELREELLWKRSR